MTIAPFIELGFNPTDLRPGDLPKSGPFLGSPAEAMEAALAIVRARMVDQVHAELKGIAEPTGAQLLTIMDLAWQGIFPAFRKVSAPVMADAYIRAYRSAEAGDVPLSVIYALADKHAEKVGLYFYGTSREAMLDGFNTMVNRRVPAKAAAGKLMDAWGLTPRQMQSFIASQQLDTPVKSASPIALKARARTYIERAFTSRTKKLSAQEEHNIEEQAKQYAWMWLMDKGRLSKKAQKIWITAKDEKVCKVCGPLNGKKVGVNEQFRTPQGEFWTPGVHPNCRCYIRLIENRFSKSAFGVVRKDLAGTALAEFNELHPRAEAGRFGTKARTKTIDVDEEFKRITSAPVTKPVRHLTYQDSPDPEIDQQFAQLISAQPKGRRGFTALGESPLATQTYADDVLADVKGTEWMVDLAADIAVGLRARTQTKPKVEWEKTPTQLLTKPAYAIVSRHDLVDGDLSRIRLHPGMRLNTDEIALGKELAEEMQETVINQTEAAMTRRRILDKPTPTADWHHRELSPQTVRRVVDWYAATATAHAHMAHDPHYHEDLSDSSMKVVYKNDRGEDVYTKDVSYDELGQRLGLNKKDFEFYLVGIDRVPTDGGPIENISDSPFSLEQQFEVAEEMDVTMMPESMERLPETQHRPAVSTFMVEPEFSTQARPLQPVLDEAVERAKRKRGRLARKRTMDT